MNESSVQESVSQPISNQNLADSPKLWNPEAAGGWSLFFHPIFGSILVLLNWQALGVKEKVRNAQIWLVVSFLVLVVSFFLPSTMVSAVTLTYLLIWYFSAAKPQAKYINERWGKAYPRRSWLWPLLIAFGILSALLCLIVVGGMAQGSF